MSAVTNSV